MKLVVASNNAKKRKEIAAILGSLGIEIVPVEQTVFIEVEENADSFAGNARKKAEAFAAANGCAALADDSGLCVDVLGGAPGVYSSRFAGGNASDTDNNAKLLEALNGTEDRAAHFACALYLCQPDGDSLSAEGRVEGFIRRAPSGESGFGYDPLFFCPELGKVFAEASAEEKASVSHRGRALRIMAERLKADAII
ncbi:MAG: non-canonical purine NTP pyrophosphatase, RdgB/HAM1 family [Zetaproteobacteria bacterium CG12_big_fil_rev_8_21_14_0_65_55_1124]|nr:MAG: non-canonical purine NTP pyrophosphatase, RdgB/HAM1 family [Zetaproteobacteria bacterium CG1_02_55_237]PIS19720.1 MAG: non-canonical purine NTP pyrophosphatase, RdgB/HAM1 family [Zetaproteobacteria bacterium CG08_land_8_20_14_0_20_55_17]PIW43486.1 MAG: non-canonical purine NTP pyrophosphatase, RdgB/HAM1 family [Zetaproteobacteria bacterium CG12_big_fil_rev_8_21_14_0_65_55_1124]PIY54118.1 MAG: non-canonical purine NTP pyrophosphatase, RdgB/HAM1 family [Zetaproteobacteria bacterium CG_4_10